MKGQEKVSGQALASGYNEAPKKNRFYALRSRGEKKISLDVVTDILKVFTLIYMHYLISVLLFHLLLLLYLKS